METSISTVHIDGSILEGGGQILRNSTAYSSLLSKPIVITRIRANRKPKSGLRPQHLTGIDLVSRLTPDSTLLNPTRAGRASVLRVGDSDVAFTPIDGEHCRGGDIEADCGTAGSICLLIQSALPVLLFAGGESLVTLKGGTNAEAAPQIDYLVEILLPFLNRFVFRHTAEKKSPDVSLSIKRRGYYPKGGGEVLMSVTPVESDTALEGFQVLDRGDAIHLAGRVFVAGDFKIDDARKIKKSVVEYLKGKLPDALVNGGKDIEIVKDERGESVGTAMGCLIWIETSSKCRIAGSSLGSSRDSPAMVGASSAKMLVTQWSHGGAFDEYLTDQVIIFMALARGESKILTGPVSLHTETAIHVAQVMTGAEFSVQAVGDGSQRMIITCEGIGLCP